MSSASSLSTLPPVEVSPWSKHALKITTPEHKYLVDGDNMAQESLNYVGPPLPRVWHSSSVVPSQSGDIFIFGGGVEDKAKNDTWAIRVSGDSNMPLPPEENHTHITVTASLVDTTGEAPSPRGAHISVMMDGVLIVWGGITSTKRGELEPSDDCVYLLNIATRNWVKLDIQPAPSARAWHAACICENKLLIFGGGVGEQQCLNDLWSFDLFLLQGNPNWERIEVAPGSPRPPEQLGHKMIAYEMKLYVFGGYSGKDVYNDTWCFNMNTRSWTRLVCTGCAPAPYTAHAVALVGDVVYMFGGEDKNENVLGDTWCFKINEHRWYKFPLMNLQPSARHGHIMVTIEEYVLIVGGMGGTTGQSEDVKMIHILDTNLIDYPEQGDEITFKLPNIAPRDIRASTNTDCRLNQDTMASLTQDTITGAMSSTEILRYLVVHGCRDISKDLDISQVSEHPVSGGGFGDVYRAKLRNGDQVGLKCVRMLVGSTAEGKQFLKYAAHELYVWSKCKHPNILELSGVAIFRNQIAMVSLWMENGHLRWFLSRHPQADRCMLCVNIADGVDYLHKSGIIHGDLKPENILVANDHTPKLTDFGNALISEYSLKFSHSNTTQNMTPRYSAPEILEGKKATHAGDIYALGVVIFVRFIGRFPPYTPANEFTYQETTTGILPYYGLNYWAMISNIIKGEVPTRPEAHIPTGIQQADRLWMLITSCWANNPLERPKASEVKNKMEGITPEGLHANEN